MAKEEKLIKEGERIFNSNETQLLNSVKGAEKELFAELIKIVKNLTITNGKISSNSKSEAFLLSMDKKIYDALRNANYTDSVLRFTKNFNEISDNVRKLHDAVNGVRITAEQINPILRIELQNTISRLTESGLAKDFINPIRQSLYRNIYFGEDITNVENTIRNFVVSNKDSESRLLRYVKQVSRDSMQQFDGGINQLIGNELGLNGVRYVGSLIEDSRAQCKKWVEKYQGEFLIADLQEEIDWALNGGVYDGKASSGMNQETTPATFFIYRGGYNCRHRAIPIMI